MKARKISEREERMKEKGRIKKDGRGGDAVISDGWSAAGEK
jgi:hypothetical protein